VGTKSPPTRRQFLARLPLPERTFLAEALRAETTGGLLLIAATVAALVWANAWPGGYLAVLHWELGPSAVHLHLPVEVWAKDGLLTVFFFVAGIELKRELVAGELRDRRAAALPVVGAVCGVVLPAALYALANLGSTGQHSGWAIPTATDIAFALGILAVVGAHLPSALRAFLLTLAVVDDLLAILIIAVFYSSGIEFWALGLAVLGIVLFGVLQRFRVRGWYLYLPLALVVWALTHESGVHATVSGVALGLLMPCHKESEDAPPSPGEHAEHLLRPLSAGFCVPVFALFAAGVPISAAVIGQVFTQAAPVGVLLGLVVGKSVGVFGGTWLAARFTRAELNSELEWADLFAMSVLSGIGFTVSLLVSELAFPGDTELVDRCKAAVLIGSVLCALIAAVLLARRNRYYRRLWLAEEQEDAQPDSPAGSSAPSG
jgi:NhaA family Na+:H+ antiporter